MNELKKKLWDYWGTLEAEKHLPKAANEVQANNNVRVRSEAAEARRQLRDAVRRAVEAVNDPNTPADISRVSGTDGRRRGTANYKELLQLSL